MNREMSNETYRRTHGLNSVQRDLIAQAPNCFETSQGNLNDTTVICSPLPPRSRSTGSRRGNNEI